MKQELTKSRDKNVLEHEPRSECVTNISNFIHEHANRSRTYYKSVERNLHTLAHPFQVSGDGSLCDGNATRCCISIWETQNGAKKITKTNSQNEKQSTAMEYVNPL